MTTVLMAIDETEASRHAAQVAVECFGPDAEYLAIYVDEERPVAGPLWGPGVTWGGVYMYPGPYAYPPAEPLRRAPGSPEMGEVGTAAGAEAEADRLAAAAGVDATPLGDLGDPSSAIISAARVHDVDVIVVGAHHRNWFGRLLHGSTSDDVVKESDVPVLVVPAERAHDD